MHQEKHAVIGNGPFYRAGLVSERATKEFLDEKRVQEVGPDSRFPGVIIGTQPQQTGFNNTLWRSPALAEHHRTQRLRRRV